MLMILKHSPLVMSIITCQGGDYTSKVHQPLRDSGWNGYWIDAASTLRMENDSIIILDPVNRAVIDMRLAEWQKRLYRW